jgi:putative DNA primase/helicase
VVAAGGRGQSIRCPAHEDRRASLSVSRGEGTKLLAYCHAGCTTDAIVSAAGLQLSDLFTDAPRATHAPLAVDRTYDYVDESGALLYQVCRMAPKDFRQRRPDARGGWIWSLGDVRRVLYRLPDLSDSRLVILAEGEKDVDALRARGLSATTSPQGAGKWRDAYADQLVAANVTHAIILPDNDPQGRAHAATIARSCTAKGIRARVVELPDLPIKGDVSDWLAGQAPDLQGASLRAALEGMAKAAPEVYTPAGEPQTARPGSRGPIVTALSTVAPEEVDWLWRYRFARGKFTLLAGEPGLGKTYLLMDCAARISRGAAWPDGGLAPLATVLYLTAEDGLGDTLRPRLDRLDGDPSKVHVLEAIREPDGSRSAVSLVRDLEHLAAAIAQVRPALVVIDPINAYLGKTDTYRDSEVRSALMPIKDLIEQHRCALVAISHLSKDAQRAALHRPSGSIAFVAAARLVLALAADPNEPDRRLLAPLKGNIEKAAPVLGFRVDGEGLHWEADAVSDVDVETIFRPAAPGDRESRSDAVALLEELLSEHSAWPMPAKAVFEAGAAHGIAERTLQQAARRLGIMPRKTSGYGAAGKWLWHRPPEPDTIGAVTAARSPVTAPLASIASIAPLKKHPENGTTQTPAASIPAIDATSRRVYARANGGTGLLPMGPTQPAPFHFDHDPTGAESAPAAAVAELAEEEL